MKQFTHILCAAALSGGFALHLGPAAGAESDIQRAMANTSYKCDAPNAEKTVQVSVAALPIVSNAALFAASDLGIFEKHGLKVEFKTVSSVPATISAVQGGAVDLAFTATLSALQALDKGLELTIIAPFAGIAPKYWDKMQAGEQGYTREITALLVAADSGIESPGDLSGKTVSVSDAQGQAELTTRYVIKKHGGDVDSVKFVVMSFADAINALMAGQVDAAYSAEPHILKAEEAGYKIISWPGVETLQEGPTSMMVSSKAYALANPDTVARFNCVIREATALGRDKPDLIRQTAAKYQGVDPAKLANAVVPYFYSVVDMEGLKRFYSLMKDAGFVTSDIDFNAIIIPQALEQ
ncbi:ABC transporter substrate-binding protein [Mesorhizobium sp. 2RAF21]|uniref:ABC transporter substrate-binding protein n=1 Tax=Mesorhizobium sp. 2RAF21 TaxID=3232995 RepID=UPI003F9C086A